ncbi:MAG: hypothetical protein RPU34_12585 [Candidatus Sedimenticola sp. (ex Thyasira tokunagai)]
MLADKNMIRAGAKSEISSAEEWLILDIGFANKSASCGLLVNNEAPVELRFNEAKERICEFITKSQRPVNLLIEAPLSVAFDSKGNPKGRAVEKQGSKTRYWYVGLGCTVMTAALYLVKAISEIQPSVEVRLFEGFVSFKEKGKKSNHSRDVMLLREVVDDPTHFSESIFEVEALKMAASDTLKSAFLVAGIDAGIPALIMRSG